MARKYSAEEWEKKEKEFLGWLKANPRASGKDAENNGFSSTLNNRFGSIDRAKALLGIQPRYVQFKEQVEITEKYLFESSIPGINNVADSVLNKIKYWKNKKTVLEEISKKRDIPFETIHLMAKYRGTVLRKIPFDKAFDVYKMLNDKETIKDISVSTGLSTWAIKNLKYESRIVEIFEQVTGSKFLPKDKYKPSTYWTKSKLDEAYDKLKQDIKEKEGKERVPSCNEVRARIPGFRVAVSNKKISGVNSYSEYVISRGDTPLVPYYDSKFKARSLQKYFCSKDTQKEAGVYNRIYRWVGDPNAIKFLFEIISVREGDILSKSDFLERGIDENKIDTFLTKADGKSLFKVDNFYTLNKKLADNLKDVWSKLTPENPKKLRQVYDKKTNASPNAIAYNKEIHVEIRNASRSSALKKYKKKMELEQTAIKRQIPEGNGHSVLKILGLLRMMENVGNAYEYEKRIEELGDTFIESYANSAPLFSQYNLAKDLLKGRLGDEK